MNDLAALVKDVREKAFALAYAAERAASGGDMDDVDTAMVDVETTIQTLRETPEYWVVVKLFPTDEVVYVGGTK